MLSTNISHFIFSGCVEVESWCQALSYLGGKKKEVASLNVIVVEGT
jgi:hypothetical protein